MRGKNLYFSENDQRDRWLEMMFIRSALGFVHIHAKLVSVLILLQSSPLDMGLLMHCRIHACFLCRHIGQTV